SDRGLAGGYNSYLLRAAEATRREIRGAGLEIDLVAVGKKAVDHFKRSGVPVAFSRVDNLPRLATIALARDIAARMLADYSSGAIDEAGIVYTHFQSAVTQKPVYQRLLPVKPPGDAGIHDGASVDAATSKSDAPKVEAPKIDYLVEPSRAELVPVVLRGYLEAHARDESRPPGADNARADGHSRRRRGVALKTWKSEKVKKRKAKIEIT